METILEKNFGYTSFRPNQEEVIEALLEDRDVFVLMPTGGGKSLCYQIPALMKSGTAVIISPLISLMKDQVDGLVSNGIDAAYLNSTLSESESIDVKRRLLDGSLKILYVAPERLMMKGMITLLKKAKVSLFAIDEAHCVSEWGHDFRPEYRQLSQLRDLFPDTCIAALTATATERVRRDIVHVLRLNDPVIKISSFNRPNLSYQIVEKKDVMKQLEVYLKKNRNKSGIIYCQSRDAVERLALTLSKAGFSALPYHAGLSDERRSRNQDRFISDDVDIIVATVAFGMGIDKPDVRFVIHYDLPKNLESYYQETGRGGRDGLECECILFFSRGDWHKIRYLIEKKPSKKERDLAFLQLSQIISYCESTDCRRNVLLRYFGEDIKEPCDNCDSCFHPRSKVDGTAEALLLIECVNQTGQRFGMSHLVDVLYGAKTQKVKDMRHDKLSIHGAGKKTSKNEWKRIGSELIRSGCLSVSGEKYPIIKLGQNSKKVIAGEMKIELTEPPISRISKGKTVLPGAVEDKKAGGAFIDEADDIFDSGDEGFEDGNDGFGDENEDFDDGNEDFGGGSENLGGGNDGFEDENEGFGDENEDFGDENVGFEDGSGTYRDSVKKTDGAIIYGGRKSLLSDGINNNETAAPPKKERKAAADKKTETVFAGTADTEKTPSKKTAPSVASKIEVGKFDSFLFNRLRLLRKKIAADKNLPPYIIFADTSLRQMATDYPTDDASFLKIIGVAEYKLQKYGGIFISEILDYLRDAKSPPPSQKTTKNAAPPLEDPEQPETVNSKQQKKVNSGRRETANLEQWEAVDSEKIDSVDFGQRETADFGQRETADFGRRETADFGRRETADFGQRETADFGRPDSADFGQPDTFHLKQRESVIPAGETTPETDSVKSGQSFFEDDLEETRSLFSQGLSAGEISEVRDLSVQKVLEHLEVLIGAGKIDNIDFLISEMKQKEISDVISRLQIEFTEKLMNSTVIEKSGGKCSEEEVRLMKALLISRMNRRKS